MKKTVLLTMIALLSLCTSANERFHIEDFTVTAGETCTVSILLENQVPYTAFQTDLYLPDGLSVVQEDDEYIFDLTPRKSRDHILASQLQYDGSIRLMSYSPNINTYSGNSGALVTFELSVAADFTGPAVIALRGTLFTNTSGVEIALPDEQCTVTVPVTVNPGDVNGDNNVNITDVTALIDLLLSGSAAPASADCNHDGLVNITDVTALIDYLLSGHW